MLPLAIGFVEVAMIFVILVVGILLIWGAMRLFTGMAERRMTDHEE